VAGIPVLQVADGTAGLATGTVTSAANAVGTTLDTSTAYSTTQADILANGEGLVTVIVNPDAVYRLHASNGATAGTALVATTNITASAGGTVITKTGAAGLGDPDVNSPPWTRGQWSVSRAPMWA